jgi:HEAT repeat protein
MARHRPPPSLAAVIVLALLVYPTACSDNRTRPELPLESIPATADPDVRRALSLLYEKSPAARGNAATRLGAAAARAAVAIPYLESMLDDDSQLSGGVSANPFFNTPDRVGFRAASALAAFGEPGKKVLLRALRDGKNDAKRAAIYALGEAREATATPLLIQILGSDQSPVVRETVPFALQKIGDKSAVEPLIAAFQRDEAHQSVWPAAGAALAELKDVRAIGPLIDVLDRSKHLTRRHLTAQILGRLDDWPGVPPEQRERAVDALTRASHEKDQIAVEAQKALDALLGDAS